MAEVSLVKQLIESGIHYGHRTSNWCPKMKPYIYTKRSGIHIIDVRQTVRGLLLAAKFLKRTVADGKDVLFVGTKRQAQPAIVAACTEAGMPYVTERWLGGTLTNFATIRSRLKRLEELEQLMAGEEWQHYSKKMASQLMRQRRKIHRNLSGIRTMDRLPGAMVVVDVRVEQNALAEAQKLGITTVCLIDTDSDTDRVDLPIPGNDDAMRAIELVIGHLMEAVNQGKQARSVAAREAERAAAEADTPPGAPRPKRRSMRAMFSAIVGRDQQEPADSEAPAGEAPAPEPAGDAPTPEAPTAEAPAPEPPAEQPPAEPSSSTTDEPPPPTPPPA